VKEQVFEINRRLAEALKERSTLRTRKDRTGVRQGPPVVLSRANELDVEIISLRGQRIVYARLMGQGRDS
jgi:hypothetical protein